MLCCSSALSDHRSTCQVIICPPCHAGNNAMQVGKWLELVGADIGKSSSAPRSASTRTILPPRHLQHAELVGRRSHAERPARHTHSHAPAEKVEKLPVVPVPVAKRPWEEIPCGHFHPIKVVAVSSMLIGWCCIIHVDFGDAR